MDFSGVFFIVNYLTSWGREERDCYFLSVVLPCLFVFYSLLYFTAKFQLMSYTSIISILNHLPPADN